MTAAKNVLFTEKKFFEDTVLCTEIDTDGYFKIVGENKDYLSDILNAYPELDRVLTKLADNFIEQTATFIIHFSEDRIELPSLLNITDKDTLVTCEVSNGETHNGSKAVCILTFSNDKKVVYKPRNLVLEAAASDLLISLNKKAGAEYHAWKIPSYLVKAEHGWSEYTPQQPVKTEDEVITYFKRAGFLLGYCTIFTASDITSDNLIANGSSPIPIDLETIFYNTLNIDSIPREVRWNVTQTSILPNWTWKGTDGVGVDLSALGGLSEQYVSLNLYQHLEDENGNSHFGMDGVKILPNSNVLYLNDSPALPWLYEKEIMEGLDTLLSIAILEKTFLTEKISSLRLIRNRYVPRPTATYHYAIQCSMHATLMSCTERRKSFLEKILNNDTAPAIGFLDAEVSACLDLDIPYAQGNTGTLSFNEYRYDGEGYLNEEEYIDGITHSINYIETLNDNRIAFEKNLTTNTLLAMKNMYEYGNKLTDHTFRQNDDLENPKCLDLNSILNIIQTSKNANSTLINNMLNAELSANGLWLGFHSSPGGYMEYSELGDDFYYGLSGMLYGCVVAASNHSPIEQDLLHRLLNQSYLRIYKKLKKPGTHLGGFHFGLSSAILPLYISLVYYKDTRSVALLELYKSYVNSVLKDSWWQKYFWGSDLLSGMFGTLSVLTKLFDLTRDKNFSILAHSLFKKIQTELSPIGNKLLIKFDNSITIRSDALLSGISHGIMGCAYAIFYFNQVIAKSELVHSIFLDFLNWELDEYDASIENWKDYRRRSESSHGEFAWSHGLPGNYLARDYFAKNTVVPAISFLDKYPAKHVFSYDSLLKRKRPVNDSLCHGAYGLLNIIKTVSPDSLLDPKIFLWSNVINFVEQDGRSLRIKTADPLGLWVGKTGSLLGSMSLLNKNYNFPFLPHQMGYI
jgi:type 2 lantibiotic biosynthesis protein LanM